MLAIRKAQVITLVLALISLQAHADIYHRFWRGTKKADLDWTQFQTGLNQVFIPVTVQTGAGKGMIAYQPALLEGAHGLPDEIALVSYSDQSAYDSLYSTDAGKAYQNLHWEYFDRDESHSVVPQAFIGSVDLEQAYDFHPEYAGWMRNTTTILVSFRGAGEAPADFLNRAQGHLNRALSEDPKDGIFDRVILVDQQYWVEYVSSSTAASTALRSMGEADLIIPVLSEAPITAQIVVGQGVNLQF